MQLSEFQARISVIARGIETNSVDLVKQVALVVDQTVVSSTPVDTGRAKTNWITALNAPSRQQINIPDPSGGVAINQCTDTLRNVHSGDSVFISNNLPYIQRLNDGWSRQAPAGFVEQAVQAGVNAVRRFRGLIR